MQIDLNAARLLQLHSLGLAHAPKKSATRSRLVAAIADMKILQIDTISVVNRSPFLVLYARLGSYPLEWLGEALESKKIFEVWSHEASFAPVAHMPILHENLADRKHWSQKNLRKALAEHGPQMHQLLKRIETDGPVKSSDFARPQLPEGGVAKGAGWWDWKPEKRWLEAWFASGHLMVAKREGFQRVYELSERLFPGHPRLEKVVPNNSVAESSLTLRQQFALHSIEALGITKLSWLHDYYRLSGRFTWAELEPLLASGVLCTVQVDGDTEPWLLAKKARPLLKRIASNTEPAPSYTVPLSPFDPLIWHRERVAQLFDFEYRIECYTPEAKRRYGYFTLPLLHRGHLIGRMDAKADRAHQVFEVKSIHLEQSYQLTDETDLVALAGSLAPFAHWHGCTQVNVHRVVDAKGVDKKKTARFLEQKIRAALALLTM